MAVRKSTASISTRALRKAFSTMSSVIGSTAVHLNGAGFFSMIFAGMKASAVRSNQDIAVVVDDARTIRQNERRGIHLDDDRGSGNAVTGFELRAIVDRRFAPAVADKHFRLGGRGRAGVARPALHGAADERFLRTQRHRAQADEFMAGVERE